MRHSYTYARHSTAQGPPETYPTNSTSEDDSSSEYQPDDEPTFLNPKAANEENQSPSEAGERTPDTQTFGITAATHLGEESATQSEPGTETTHPREESQAKVAEEEHSHHACFVTVWWLESSRIALILCFIVTNMHSNLISKFGLIW